ncbi:sulfatase [Amycolatopsis sp. FDAARGOS 1241]|uniref:sulfatase family protein n=1 Tax=Amycolatopsis sp. FDAARGOS 1241 TaxID=2778070 RepID=UPI00194EB5D5|nr:sulfatase [Amycolatopsis sp. FDAARGOS 1241]QRP42613.1 sulfatase [Amycolatopsis sp. FDAARGOS 1241]
MTEPSRPNILLVHWHDLGRHLGAYGHPGVPSPNVDRLAEQGLRFDNAFATAPLCSPARGSLFTGRYPHDNGLLGLAHLGWEYRAGVQTLPALLGDAGYRTALAGMQHESSDPSTLGYQEFFALRTTYLEREYCDGVTDAATAWLARAALEDRPFFLSVGFEEVHRPYPTDRYAPDDPARVEVPPFLPDNAWTRDDLASFQGSIRAADAAVGRLLSAVDELRLTADTWVVFTTDHGVAFPRAKSTLYDPGTGVALIMRPPAAWPSPRGATDRLFSHVDFVPTVLDALGLPVPPEVQGVSHAQWLRGGDPAPSREHVFTEKNFHDIYDPLRAVRDAEFKYLRNFEPRPLLPLPGDLESSPTRYGYGDAHLAHRPAEELYDLRDDPWEQRNVAADPRYAEVRARLSCSLESWQQDSGDPLLKGPLPAPPWPRQPRYGALVADEGGPWAR